MAHVSHKLSGSLQGALAGGGDPASSPLYVFGPFLRLVVAAGVARVTFGASIWLAVLTVAAVSGMYRLVMIWVVDGSGGSGLSEEELGPWAARVNASITVIEYTLTFLVSIAALVTFVADRVPVLNEPFLGRTLREPLAVLLTLLTGALVNRGPRMASRIFGPATAGVLVLLWVLIVSTIWNRGIHLPPLHREAFSGRFLRFTLAGYARILALMTGIEIFANLVAAYEGPARERSRKAFRSLVIVMGTTSLTMLVVGPAILALTNPFDPRVSVFTQAMDALLPGPARYLGTLVGVAVLLSAAAASAQGLQNLALGLRYRNYVPAILGRRNKYDVADNPVWLQAGVCVLCFLIFGTAEETYLALYAAGVFVLLSLTGWAAVRRLGRLLRVGPSPHAALSLAAVLMAALLASCATVTIFGERFREGAWAYCLLVPSLYLVFGWFRSRLGAPAPVEERLGMLLSSSSLSPRVSRYPDMGFRNVLVPLDGSMAAEQATIAAQLLSHAYGSKISLLSVSASVKGDGADDDRGVQEYLKDVARHLRWSGSEVSVELRTGDAPTRIGEAARSGGVDLVVMTTHGRKPWSRWLTSSVTSEVIYQTTPPLLLLRPTDSWKTTRTRFSRLLVPMDGSETAEQVMRYVHELAGRFNSHVTLISALEGGDSDAYRAKLAGYLDRLRLGLTERGVSAALEIVDSAPAQAVVRAAEAEKADTIMMVSHGRGGTDRQRYVRLGSVVDAVLQATPCPVFLVSALPTVSYLHAAGLSLARMKSG